jgi:hypothetical protein
MAGGRKDDRRKLTEPIGGLLRRLYFLGQMQSGLAAWAKREGVDVLDTTVEEERSVPPSDDAS